MLGRVLGLEYSIARCCEALVAFIAGRLEDKGYGKYEIASLSASLGVVLLTLWSAFHITGRGAAKHGIVSPKKKELALPLVR
jgi:hypothetical protein